MKDLLFLLPPDFLDSGKSYYCPSCAEMIGLLEFYPKLKEHIEVHYADFQRPRPEIVKLIGESNQGCPVLILSKPPQNIPAHIQIHSSNGRSFIDEPKDIGEYLAHVYGIGLPH